jgi:hypothetical protein
MPRVGQIVPEFLHPHVQTYINDNTVFVDEVAEVTNPLRTLAVFASPKGRDNKFIQIDSQAAYLAEFGNPKYSLYGQPGYMPYAFLSQPETRVYCMRIMPDNAAYANLLIKAKVRVDSTDPLNPKLETKFVAEYFTGVNLSIDFLPSLEGTLDLTPDGNGFVTYPLMVIYSLGRGLYGNNMRVRISSHAEADKDNDYKNYRIELFDTENGLQRVEMMTGAAFIDAVQGFAQNTYYLEDVVNDGSAKIGCYFHQPALNEIFNIYKTDVDPDTAYTVKDFDFITGINKYTNDFDTHIVVNKTAADAVSLDRIEGVALSGGNDGAFDANADPAAREIAMNNKYIAAFEGEIDRKILSKRRMPCEFIFDANYQENVKKTLINLIVKRYDGFGYVDAGILNSAGDAMSWAEYFEDYGDRIFSKNCQHYKMRDPFSGKAIPMTVTYYIASKIATHFRNFGSETPLVGEAAATLTGYIRDTLMPVIDADDNEVKEYLYGKKVNYFQSIAENTHVRAVQSTSQFSAQSNKFSDLSEESNMHVLLYMKRVSEQMVASALYNFAEAEDRQRYTENLDIIFKPLTGIKVRSYGVKFEMNAWEEERSILHCYLDVVFRTIAKRGIIEIDINKRV